jgi:hypothetical protein
MHSRQPNAGHHQLVMELNGTLDKFELRGIPKVEQVALLAQIVGRLICECDGRQYTSGELMACVAMNIASGNKAASDRLNFVLHTVEGEASGG